MGLVQAGLKRIRLGPDSVGSGVPMGATHAPQSEPGDTTNAGEAVLPRRSELSAIHVRKELGAQLSQFFGTKHHP